jgi:hypothetical protein
MTDRQSVVFGAFMMVVTALVCVLVPRLPGWHSEPSFTTWVTVEGGMYDHTLDRGAQGVPEGHSVVVFKGDDGVWFNVEFYGNQEAPPLVDGEHLVLTYHTCGSQGLYCFTSLRVLAMPSAPPPERDAKCKTARKCETDTTYHLWSGSSQGWGTTGGQMLDYNGEQYYQDSSGHWVVCHQESGVCEPMRTDSVPCEVRRACKAR